MIPDLKPYPAMKDSGVEWLGQVPEHWQLVPVCTLATPKSTVGQAGRELLSVYLKLGVVPFSAVEEKRTNTTSQDLSKYQAVDPGDLVMNNQQAWRGSVGVSAIPGIVSPAYLVLALDNAKHLTQYANLLFRSRSMVDQYLVSSRGVGTIQRNLYWPHLKRAMTLVPPEREQAAIVRYLDHVDRRVRRLVRAKRKLIELLTEQKQMIIHRAVTRGLDPDVQLKDSGIEWLGQLPEHWTVRRSKFTFKPRQELAQPDDVQLSATQAYGVIPQAEYERRVGRKVVRVLQHLDKRRHVEVDDFVISMRSFQGGLERAWSSGAIRSSYIVLHPNVSLDVGYFGFLFKSRAYIGALQSTADFIRDGQDLNFDNFSAVDLPFPPVEEQRRISATLTPELAQIVEATERAELEIALINEYRERLIADVVTGKLDVRDVAAALPDVDPLDAEGDLDAAPGVDAEDDLDATLEEAEA